MFFAIQVPQRWLVSRRAMQVYSLSAALQVALSALFILVPMGPLITRIILVPLALGCATIWTAMWYFWVTVHPSNSFGKGYWAVLLVLFGPVGSLIYFLLVYLRYRPSVGHAQLAASAGA